VLLLVLTSFLTPKLGLTKLLDYHIQLLDHTPHRYRFMPPKVAILREQVQHMLDQRFIKTSASQ
jgi:hypothetical protein